MVQITNRDAPVRDVIQRIQAEQFFGMSNLVTDRMDVERHSQKAATRSKG